MTLGGADVTGALMRPTERTALARAVATRLGLSRLGNAAALQHRLSLLRDLAGRPTETEGSFITRLGRADEGSSLWDDAADVLPNRETCFFRDVEQLRSLVQRVGSAVREREPRAEPVRILSVGCALGEEVYSLAMLLLDEAHLLWGRRVLLVGVDVSPKAVELARSGRFARGTLNRAGPGPARWERRFFREDGNSLVARPWLQAMTQFERANLVRPATLTALGTFDAVLCRNVLIYFCAEAADAAVHVLWSRVAPGGILQLGGAEGALAGRLPNARCHNGFVPCFEKSGNP